jgi:hypothetical protein
MFAIIGFIIVDIVLIWLTLACVMNALNSLPMYNIGGALNSGMDKIIAVAWLLAVVFFWALYAMAL